MTRPALAIAFFGTLGAISFLSGCEPRLMLGGACAYASECSVPLACRLGRCREECRSVRDCPLGSRCLPDEASGLGACRLPDESTCSTTCPAQTDCVAGVCAARCVNDEACLGTACDLTISYCTELVLTDSGVPRDAEVTDATDAAGPDAPLDCASCGSGLCGVGDTCDPVVEIAAGALLSCLRRASGAVDCAGSDSSGSLGDGLVTWPSDIRSRFAPVAGSLRASAIAVGWEHACALDEGAVWCWGRGDFGQIGTPGTSDAPMLVIAANATDAIVSVTAGGYHTCVLHVSGSIDCFGRNDLGQLGDGIMHGPCQSEMDCTTAPVRVAAIDDAMAIDAYRFNTCAIRRDGSVWCWGGDEHGVLGGATEPRTRCPSPDVGGAMIDCSRVPVRIPALVMVSAVSIAGEHGCAISAGDLYCWGDSDNGRLGIAADAVLHPPARVTLPSAPVDVEAGGYHTTVLGLDGRLYAFGLNDDARLGRPVGMPASSASPLEVPTVSDVRMIAGGSFHTCALDGAGVVACWGLDEQGQAGDGMAGVGSPPTPVVRE